MISPYTIDFGPMSLGFCVEPTGLESSVLILVHGRADLSALTLEEWGELTRRASSTGLQPF